MESREFRTHVAISTIGTIWSREKRQVRLERKLKRQRKVVELMVGSLFYVERKVA